MLVLVLGALRASGFQFSVFSFWFSPDLSAVLSDVALAKSEALAKEGAFVVGDNGGYGAVGVSFISSRAITAFPALPFLTSHFSHLSRAASAAHGRMGLISTV